MAVRKDARKGWMVDFVFTHANGRSQRVCRRSPVQRKARCGGVRATTPHRTTHPDPAKGGFQHCGSMQPESWPFGRVRRAQLEAIRRSSTIICCPDLRRSGWMKLVCSRCARFRQLSCRGVGRKRLNSITGVLTMLLRKAVEDGVIGEAPRLKKLPVPQARPRFLSFDQCNGVLEQLRHDALIHDVALMAMKAGLRYGELTELRRQDVDFWVG